MKSIEEVKKGDYVKLSPYLCKKGDRINNAIFMVRYILMGIRNNERLIRLAGFDSMMRQDDIIPVDLKETAPDEFVFDPDLMRVEYSHTVADGYSSSPVFKLTDIKESIKDGDFVKFKDSITSFGKDASSTVFKVENIGLYTIVKLKGISEPVRVEDLEKVNDWKEKGYVFAEKCDFFVTSIRKKGNGFYPEEIVMIYMDRSCREKPDDDLFGEFEFASEVFFKTGSIPERCKSGIISNNNNSENMEEKEDIKRGDYVVLKKEFMKKGNLIDRFMFEVKDTSVSEGVSYVNMKGFASSIKKSMIDKVKDENKYIYFNPDTMCVVADLMEKGNAVFSVGLKGNMGHKATLKGKYLGEKSTDDTKAPKKESLKGESLTYTGEEKLIGITSDYWNGPVSGNTKERSEDDYKNDFIDGKTRWDLIPWEEIEDLAELYTEGAKKYKPGSWKNLKDGFERYGAAAMRHYMKYRNGERYDPETGAHHLTAVVWNTIAMLWFDKHGGGLLPPETENNDK